jgi:nicotinate phosphoribosyltransferase
MADARPVWVSDANVALLTDLYQLTMVQAYWREELFADAVFSLFVRRLPPTRNYLLAAGLADVLSLLERLAFSDDALGFVRGRREFRPDFVDWLAALRFTGSVRALPEGTPFFANEPILEVRAPLPQAQLLETLVMNQIHLQTLLASKAARVVRAAAGRRVVDFGLRRMHGADAGIKSARAFHIAGVHATSNVLAGRVYGVPLAGTMAHSYIQAHGSEESAFRAFMELYPETTLLVDTYDTTAGVRLVVRLARELGDAFRVRAVRLDSGDLLALARDSRRLLDEAGLQRVQIFASSSLDEYEIERLLEGGAPIDGFGVGTALAVSADAPALDLVYKLAEYAGRGRLKLSPGKQVLPGEKQVYRVEEDGRAVRDMITAAGEEHVGRPLLVEVMRDGARTDHGRVTLAAARSRAAEETARLPERLRELPPAQPGFPVAVGAALARLQRQETERIHREEQ